MHERFLQMRSSSNSSAQEGKETKHLVIYYPGPHTTQGKTGVIFCVPVESLIPNVVPDCTVSELELPQPKGAYLKDFMTCICISTSVGAGKRRRRSQRPRLYFFGGVDPPVGCQTKLQDYGVKDVYRYDLHKLPKKVGSGKPCTNMVYGMCEPLLAQIGDDCIYVLGHGKAEFNDSLGPVFHKYNFKEDKWTSLDDDHHIVDIVNNCNSDGRIRNNLIFAPHVVIGDKWHVSIGNSSFAFDTKKGVWEDSKLFENFWRQLKKEGSYKPSNFYGTRVFEGLIKPSASKKRKRNNKFGGGPPFGFTGRGIIWDENILLGVHYAEDQCSHLVAFLLDEEGGVVKSQKVFLDNVVTEKSFCPDDCAYLVDLGQDDGHFGLLHFASEKPIEDGYVTRQLYMELVAFKISRLEQEIPSPDNEDGDGDDDFHFLGCQFVSKKVLAKNCRTDVVEFCSPFCV